MKTKQAKHLQSDCFLCYRQSLMSDEKMSRSKTHHSAGSMDDTRVGKSVLDTDKLE